ncbi:MAG: carboxypeptidase-like regulatory domain-containing protein, partial [Bacteroidia bacterium]
MKRRVFYLLLSTIVFFTTKAQEYTQTIRGTVVEKQTKQPIPGVVINLQDSSGKYCQTDKDGNYKLLNVPIGRRGLRFYLTGYKNRYVTVIVSTGKESILNIEMEENIIQGEEIQVIIEKDKTQANNKKASVSARIFSAEEAGRYAGST